MPIRPGWSRERLFNSSWVRELNKAVSVSYDAEISIYSVDMRNITYDPAQGTYSGSVKDSIYEGLARVQPIRMARNVPNNAGDTIVQAVRVQLGDTTVPIQVNDRVRVTKCNENAQLETYEFTVYEIMNASNAFDLTFEATSDTEHRNG